MRRLAIVALALACGACLNLDVFVFRSLPVDDDNADLFDGSAIPKELREEIKGDLKSADGTVVDAYLVKHKPDDGTPVQRHGIGILYCHGQNTNIQTTWTRVDALWQLGYTVLIYDARGYGKTKGTPTEEAHYADARAARTYLEGRQDLGMDADHVAIYGRSLGSLFATKISAERPPKALLLESPVLSIQTIIDDSLSVSSSSQWYADAQMDNSVELPKFTGALLIMHGDADDFVQQKYGRQLHDLAEGHANPNEFWSVPGADHSNVPCASLGPAPEDNRHACPGGISDAYNSHVTTFLDRAYGL